MGADDIMRHVTCGHQIEAGVMLQLLSLGDQYML